jgi:hypothetical protein
MNLQSLRRKALDNSLEVEYILRAARERVPGLSAELASLTHRCEWSFETHLPDGTHVVPFARWAAVASAYADQGFQGLHRIADDEDSAPYVIGLLEELNTSEAIDALLTIFANSLDEPSADHATTHRLVQAINLLFSMKSSPASAAKQRLICSRFLNKTLSLAQSNAHRAVVMYAMRGTGDSSCLEALSHVRDAEPPYAGAKASAIKAIQKRLRNEA